MVGEHTGSSWALQGAGLPVFAAKALPRSASEYFLHRQSWKPSSQWDHNGHPLSAKKWRAIATEGDPPPNQSPCSSPWTGAKRPHTSSLSGLVVLGESAGGAGGSGPGFNGALAAPRGSRSSAGPGQAEEDEEDEDDEESPWTPRLTHIKPKASVKSKSFQKAFESARALSLEASTYGFSDAFKPSLSRTGSRAGMMHSMGNTMVGGAPLSSSRRSARFGTPAIRPGTWHHDSSPRGKYR